jgi:Tfp pilus assembly protein PilF
MSNVKEKLGRWLCGLDTFDCGETISALEHFMSAPCAKNFFNSGMCAMKLRDGKEAVRAFSCALKCDPFLAVAMFQRGVCHFAMSDVLAALGDFERCLLLLRGNTSIRYHQLGLRFELLNSHILLNIGLCKVAQNDNMGLVHFNTARKC